MDKQMKELIDLICLRGGECSPYIRFDSAYAICSHYVHGKRMGPKELPVDKLISALGCDTYQSFLKTLSGLLEAWRRPSLSNVIMNIKMHKFQQFLADRYVSSEWLKYAFVKPYLLDSGRFLHDAFVIRSKGTICKAVEDNLRQAYWYFRGLYLLEKHKDSIKVKTVTIPLDSVNISNGRVIGLRGVQRGDLDDMLVNRLLKYAGIYNTPVDYTQTNNLNMVLRYYYLPEDIDPEGVVSKMLVIQNSSLRAEGVYYTVIVDSFDNRVYAPTLSVEVPLSIGQTQKG